MVAKKIGGTKLVIKDILKPTKLVFGKVMSLGKIQLPFPASILRGLEHRDFTLTPHTHISKKYKKFANGDILSIKYRESAEKRLIITAVSKLEIARVSLGYSAGVKGFDTTKVVGNILEALEKCEGLLAYQKVEISSKINSMPLNPQFLLPPHVAFSFWKNCWDLEVGVGVMFDSTRYSELTGTEKKWYDKIGFADSRPELVEYVKRNNEMAIKIEEQKNTPDSIWVGDKWIPKSVEPFIEALGRMEAFSSPINIMATGESGYGKTTLFQTIAEKFDMDFLRIDCATVVDTEAWFGYQEARDGSTVFESTQFTEAITKGNCVVVLDEANRIEPWIANSLFPILDHAGEITVHGQKIVVAKDVIFGLTMNIGGQFSGTFEYDAALRNRMDVFFEIDAPPFNIECEIVSRKFPEIKELTIKKVLLVITELRNREKTIFTNVSTRTVLKIMRLLSFGMDIREAFKLALINSADAVDRKELIDVINTKIGV